MKYFIYIFVLMIPFSNIFAITGDEILKKVDDTMTSDNKIATSKMIIHGRRGSRSIESKSWMQGIEKSFTEYLSPAREKGTKMLKIEDQLWTYSPQTDRTIRIAGHMLRQSVMGSDLSYEDYTEDPKLVNLYNAEILAEEKFNERSCWVLNLEAKTTDIAYFSRKIWVDKERFLALKEERFAKSGTLLKILEVNKVKWMSNRWVPVEMLFKDQLKQGKGTEFIIESIQFNADVPNYIFTKAALKK